MKNKVFTFSAIVVLFTLSCVTEVLLFGAASLAFGSLLLWAATKPLVKEERTNDGILKTSYEALFMLEFIRVLIVCVYILLAMNINEIFY